MQSSVERQRRAECVDGLPNLSDEEALIARDDHGRQHASGVRGPRFR